jgi:hypothetical protein
MNFISLFKNKYFCYKVYLLKNEKVLPFYSWFILTVLFIVLLNMSFLAERGIDLLIKNSQSALHSQKLIRYSCEWSPPPSHQ